MTDLAFVTPLERLTRFSDELGIDLWIKRDDLFPQFCGGNKARKISYILREAVASGCNAIVTAGSPVSNHARVCALASAQLGWKCSLIIHPDDPTADLPLTGNLLLMHLAGAEFTIVDLAHAGEAMDGAMERLRLAGYNPFYVWGGGHCVAGSLAYYEAVGELKSQFEALHRDEPDFVFVASGTGSTQAGIHLGAARYFNDCKVVGISISRWRERGQRVVEKSISDLADYLHLSMLPEVEIVFKDEFMGSGYGDTLPETADMIRRAIAVEALVLDPVYTAKAFYGLAKMVETGEIPMGSSVVFWNTGCIVSLLSVSQSKSEVLHRL